MDGYPVRLPNFSDFNPADIATTDIQLAVDEFDAICDE
jgi:hypothetical protein